MKITALTLLLAAAAFVSGFAAAPRHSAAAHAPKNRPAYDYTDPALMSYLACAEAAAMFARTGGLSSGTAFFSF